MNILLVVLAIILIWRISVGIKKGVVREVVSLVNVLFVALVIGLVSITINAYHSGSYLTIAIMFMVIVVLSVLYSIIKIVIFPAKVVAKLPVVSSVDRLLGVVIGVAETLVVFWMLCYAMMYIEFGTLNTQILMMIEESKFLTALYQYNLLGVLLEGLKAKLYLK